MRIVIQIGFKKSSFRNKKGQIIRAWINDQEVSWSDDCKTGGYWLTSPAEGRLNGETWYVWEGDLSSGDLVRLDVRTGIAGVGSDESRTFESLYQVDENADIKEITVPGVGKKNFPIIKGRLAEIGSVSAKDKRQMGAEDFIDGEF